MEYCKDWFGKSDIVLSDVLEEREGVYVMSVNEDMCLYIFKSKSVCDLIEKFVMENV